MTLWEDRELRFDVTLQQLQLRPGEKVIDKQDSIEDIKGVKGKGILKGPLTVTNLRLLWHPEVNPKVNLSIGLKCILEMKLKTSHSKLDGTREYLYILSKFNGTRFEYNFTSAEPEAIRLFDTAMNVQKDNEVTTFYRDLKLKEELLENQSLKLIESEELHDKMDAVWNVSGEQGNQGAFYFTNIRTVWYSYGNENFNVSIPYVQMDKVIMRDSPKFGLALVISISQVSGGYVLGFRIDPPDKLLEALTIIQKLKKVCDSSPILGPSDETQNQLQTKASLLS